MRKDWRKYDITNEVDELIESGKIKDAFIVFEEPADNKHYDLSKGVFSDLEVAKEYAEALNADATEEDKNHVTNYMDYINGSYNYL